MLRALRIGAIALALPLLFALSQRVAEARGQEPVPGMSWAVGAVSMLFLLRALVTEWSTGPEANRQKDLFWGLSAGGLITILWRGLHG
jgi:hypothetical protein